MIKPPPGFVLDQPDEEIVPPPPGFVLDAPASMGAKASEFAGNLGQNALDFINPVTIAKGVGSTIKEGLLDVPLDVAKSSVQLLQSGAKTLIGEKSPSDALTDIQKLPIVERTRAMTEGVAKDPAGFAFKRPLDAASLLLGPIVPFLRKGTGVAATKAVSADVAPSLGRRMAAKAISTGFGAPEEAILERMKNPAGVKTAFSHPELADQMVESISNFTGKIKDLSGQAGETLRSSPFIADGAIPKTTVINAIKQARNELGGIFSQEAKSASQALKNVADKFKKLRTTVSEKQAKDLIQQLDADIDWGNPSASRTNEALVGVRTRLDALLKKQNPHYAEAIKPVAEAVRVMDEVQKKFGIKRKTGQGFFADDQTVGRIRSALKEDRIGTKKILDRFQKITGEDWESKIKNANISEAFVGEKTQGSRRAVIGGTVGEVIGRVVGLPPASGAALGAIAGAFADIYGRRLAGRLADALSVPEMQRYIPRMQQAAVKGPKALAVLHARLIENDPDYTATMAAALSAEIAGNNRGAKQ